MESRYTKALLMVIIIIIIIIIGIQPLGRFGQRPEFSQATGMALVRCILGKFLGVASHCFPPLFSCSHFSPPGASTSLGILHEMRRRLLSSVACPALNIFPHYRVTGTIFEEKSYYTQNMCFDFLYKF